MLVPLDYYRILGVPPTATDGLIAQAYPDRLLQLPRWEYSEAAIESRRSLLEQAFQVLIDPQERDRYQQQWRIPSPEPEAITIADENLQPDSFPLETSPLPSTDLTVVEETELDEEDQKTTVAPAQESLTFLDSDPPEIKIAPDQWVGALLFLQELGEYEQVIRQIEGRIQVNPGESLHPFGSDIPAVHHNDIELTLALAYLEISREQWHHQQYESAAQSGMRGLARIEKQAILPSLQAEIRTELNKLRPYRILELLSNLQSSPSDRQQGVRLLKELLQQRQGIEGGEDDGSELDPDNFLLFIQQIRCFLTVEEQLSLFEEESRRPSPVANCLTAHALLAEGCAQKQPQKIVQAYERFKSLNFHQESWLEKSVCALLLGQTETSLSYLRQHQDFGEPLAADEDPDVVLQKVCAVAEQWLRTELFPRFIDLARLRFSLKDYFADRAVQNYLEEYIPPLLDSIPEQEPIMVKPQPLSYDDYPHPKDRIRSSRRFAHRRSTREVQGTVTHRAATTVAERELTVGDRPTDPMNSSPTNGTTSRPQNHDESASNGSTVRLAPRSTSPRSRRKKPSIRIDRVILLVAMLLGGLGALGMSVKWAIDRMSPLSQLEQEQLFISMNKPLIETPSANALLTAGQDMTPEYAQQLLQTWLASKADAFGEAHQSDKLAEILDGSLLKTWQKRANDLSKIDVFWRYQHSLEANSLKVVSSSPNQAKIEAIIREKATYFQNGKEIPDRSYDDTLRVRYGLVRQGDRWLIQSIQVLQSL